MKKAKICPKCGTRTCSKHTICTICKKEFFGIRNAMYCSIACKLKAYRKRKNG